MSAGRGRRWLNSIDTLPDWAYPAVSAALAHLKDNKLTQLEILDGLNAEIRSLGFAEGITDPPQISQAAFNRQSMRIAAIGHRLAKTREIASALAQRFEDGSDTELTILASDTIKTICFELMEEAKNLTATPKTAEMMANFAAAIKSAEQAKKITAEAGLVIDKNFKKKVAGAVENLGKEKGLSPEVKAAFMAEVLGVRQK